MDIDLSKVIGYSRDSLQSRALMRSIMLDLYPGKTREMNVLLDVYESGVPRKIKNDGNITDAKYAQYIQKIVDDYGMQEQWAVVGLNAWIDICLGNGTASRLKYVVQKPVVGNANSSVNSGNSGSGGHTHNQSHNQPVVSGKVDDYEIRDISATTIEISKFVGFDENKTIIPNEINGKRVVAIGKAAFANCKGIETLIVSEGIEQIGDEAFSQCNNLRIVQLPTSLRKVGASAFSSTAIESIDMPNGINKIENRTFSGCRKLQSIIFSDNLSEIGSSAFSYCTMLQSITLPPSMRVIGSGAFSECGKMVKAELNEGLVEIGGNAFKKCNSLTTLTMPSTVIKFGNGIFEGQYSFSSINITVNCYPGSKAIEYLRNNKISINPISPQGSTSSQVRKVTMPAPIVHKPIQPTVPIVNVAKDDYEIRDISATTIEISKFVGFDESKTIIPNEINGKRVVAIGKAAFANCKGIETLIISEGIEQIGDEAFSQCNNLRIVQLPTTLRKIGASAFSSTAVERMDIPNGVTKIESRTFSSCRKLQTIVLSDNLSEIGSSAFSYCTALYGIVLPPSMRVIGSGAFSECTNLSNVKLNEGLVEMGANAFKKCNAMKILTIPSSVCKFGNGVFEGQYSFSSIDVTLYCYPRSKAIEYARNNKIKIEDASK